MCMSVFVEFRVSAVFLPSVSSVSAVSLMFAESCVSALLHHPLQNSTLYPILPLLNLSL